MAFNFAMFSRTKLDTHAPLVPDYTICEFQSGTKCVLRLYDFSLHHTQTKVSLGLKTGLNQFRNDLYGNKISSRYHSGDQRVCKSVKSFGGTFRPYVTFK